MVLPEPHLHIGHIIMMANAVERNMDIFLAFHFCADTAKRNEFSNKILFHERISFEFKKEILISVVKEHYNWIVKQHPDFLSTLSAIPEHRNRFAHLDLIGYGSHIEITTLADNNIPVWDALDQEKKLDTSDPYQLIFKKYKNGKLRYIGYSFIGLTKLRSGIMDVIEVFRNIAILLYPDLPPETA
jgi:hypothetical protein